MDKKRGGLDADKKKEHHEEKVSNDNKITDYATLANFETEADWQSIANIDLSLEDDWDLLLTNSRGELGPMGSGGSSSCSGGAGGSVDAALTDASSSSK